MIPKLVHDHLLVRAEVDRPPMKQDRDKLQKQMKDLIEAIDMNILSGPHTEWSNVEGNEGYSSVAIIDTSSITFHSWTNGIIQLDVYSCKSFPIQKILDWLGQFGIQKIDYKFIDRDKGFEPIS